ncbi:MAG TPA: hypothetical protein VFS52_23005 [Steroidobacteraceae bacterium]|nr:hypothetical protein [Steroidobacteraceae bacterium]
MTAHARRLAGEPELRRTYEVRKSSRGAARRLASGSLTYAINCPAASTISAPPVSQKKA